ncbi:MAG TPA: ester cyclase [Actinomycetota bacterium]|nr:ester cyclase [Actinomycetota bacterium]
MVEGRVSQKNKDLLRRFAEEGFNQGDTDVVDEIVADDFVYNDSTLPSGRDGVKQVIQMFRMAFPDGRLSIESLIAEGDLVVARSIFTSIHSGEFIGIPPTGRAVHIQGLISRASKAARSRSIGELRTRSH